MGRHTAAYAYLVLHGRAVQVVHPEYLWRLVQPLLGASPALPDSATVRLVLNIEPAAGDRFSLLSSSGGELLSGLGLGDVLHETLIAAQRELLRGVSATDLVLHAASVARGIASVLIAGDSRSGKSTLAAWFATHGFDYLTDEVSVLSAQGNVEGLGRPMTFRDEAWNAVSSLGWITQVVMMADGRRLAQAPGSTALPLGPKRCGLIIFPKFVQGVTARLEAVRPAQAAARLMGQNYSASSAPDYGLAALAALAAGAPAVQLTYGDLDEIEALEAFAVHVLESGQVGLAGAINAANIEFTRPAEPPPSTPVVPSPTPKRGPVRLTIGMATYDDYDGVYFTIQALRLFHPVAEDTELVVIDNHPQGYAAQHLKALENVIPNYRYVPYGERSGSASSKQRIFEEAQGRYVLGLDCHVLLVPNAVARLLSYFEANPDTSDLLQGPLLYDDLSRLGSHWDPEWRGGMFGTWSNDPRAEDIEGPPFEIPMQGLGLYACRRAVWPGFNSAFRGFGGEEGYLHEKFRQSGHRVLCLPFLRWMHRFARPTGTPFANTWEDRIHNYLVGAHELGGSTADMESHFDELLTPEVARPIFERLRRELQDADASSASARPKWLS